MTPRMTRIAEAVGSTPNAAAALNLAAGHALEDDRDGCAFYCAAAATFTVAAHPELGLTVEDLAATLLGMLTEDRVLMPPTDMLN